MHTFSTSIDIAQPVERAWSVMIDVDHWHEWTPSITSVRRLGGQPLAVGSRVLIRQPMFPPALWAVSALVPGERFSWVSVAPGLRVTGHHDVVPISGGSRATLGIEIDGLCGGLWARLTRAISERYLGYEAQGLKARAGDGAYRHGGLPRSPHR
ncbi:MULTISPECIES: SRPBCC family protein [unclassified Polaromonas]|jgi:uncharacterized membrane protein|uniref:SRPBCC family protein n=1 Tax=unclassified Polaromonas TaxID=2638319 RepID=UPI000BCD89CE|nr:MULTISPECIES: SRPBCC family protein [unclassified Polaromonas]OYY33612.1 MAG: hypothetical protein B7Y60_18400 [Polaromonas sp. 35-63-35]OYZ18144.1 MAG: hypothetical protein B7Y28_16875 [Polaromonas sp. 16-63-31]OYZ77130.1 MAG: hypothetical protein B7Y09_17720 [Polaromonas sp. 24-63-21]OZA51217.1 MAG: hypothetical protein B7X88_06210 [Polaromonas sp. 17-63-33]OZA86456.1 MAG: hypothetical protein B7X65_17120 [Polaromonas sp. 39-63-25]